MTDREDLSRVALYSLTAVIAVFFLLGFESGPTLMDALNELSRLPLPEFVSVVLPALLIGAFWYSAEHFHIHRLLRIVLGVTIACSGAVVEHYVFPQTWTSLHFSLETVVVTNAIAVGIPAILVCLVLDWLRKPIRISPEADPFHGGVE